MSADWPYGGPDLGYGGAPAPATDLYGDVSLPTRSNPLVPPTSPRPGPDRSKRRRRLLVGSGVGLALAGLVVVAWPAPGPPPGAHPTPGASPSGSASISSPGGVGIPDEEVAALFARRSAAVHTGSLTTWLADVDPANKALVAHQTQLFAGLRALPLVSYDVQVARSDYYVPAAYEAGATRYRSPGLRVVYQLRGYDPAPVARAYAPILAEHAGHVLIEGEQTAQVDPTSELEPWDSGPIAVASGKHALVIVSPVDKRRLPALVARADAAVGWVSAMWPKVGSGHPVVYALRDRAVIARYVVRDTTASDFDAVTVAAYDPAKDLPVVGSRVLFNPKFVTPASSADLLDDTLRHEFTHVAHFNDSKKGTPTWVVEGIAEYTSFRGHRADQRVSNDIGKAARAGKLPKTLPRSTSFYSDARGIHYGISWLAVEYFSETYGESKVRRLYTGLAAIASPRDSKAALTAEDAVFVRVAGVSEAGYVRKLNAWVAQVLRTL